MNNTVFDQLSSFLVNDSVFANFYALLTGKDYKLLYDTPALIIYGVILGIIVFFALTGSVSRRSQRDRTIKECWEGKNRAVAAILALVLGPAGIHRFYLRNWVTGILQILGTGVFVWGAFILGEATVRDFLLMSSNVTLGLLLLLTGLFFELWHISDFFMILFGGMIPRRKKEKEKQKAVKKAVRQDPSMYARPVAQQRKEVNPVPAAPVIPAVQPAPATAQTVKTVSQTSRTVSAAPFQTAAVQSSPIQNILRPGSQPVPTMATEYQKTPELQSTVRPVSQPASSTKPEGSRPVNYGSMSTVPGSANQNGSTAAGSGTTTMRRRFRVPNLEV